MSASLVGSEMCIRDRKRGESSHSPACTRAQCMHKCGHTCKCLQLCCPRPVSYTHLTLPTICSV
eukprot:5020367-Alexandrium_andersonii.AAC.1